MENETSIIGAAGHPKLTLAMVLCGMLGVAAGTASAANVGDDVPKVSVKYDPKMLATDSGARTLYRRIVNAAEQACPDLSSGSHFVNPAVRQCREEAVARAVQQVNNPRLVEIATVSAKRG